LQERTFSPTDVLLAERFYTYKPGGRLSGERSRTIDDDVTYSTHVYLTYLTDGRLLTRTASQQRRSPRSPPSDLTLRESRTYAASGHLLQEERVETLDTYSTQMLQTCSYDAQGRLATVETSYGGRLTLRRVATYDAQGRLTRVDRFGEYAGEPDLYTYPAEGGWLVEHRAPGWVESWRYDTQGRLRERLTGDHSGSSGEG
jgi:YD repeat-containing protein